MASFISYFMLNQTMVMGGSDENSPEELPSDENSLIQTVSMWKTKKMAGERSGFFFHIFQYILHLFSRLELPP
jgi:hypothetical protein